MKSVAVESTTLAKVAYDVDRQLLELEFCDQRIYQYSGVPTEIHVALLLASSKGNYFNRHIRGQFTFCRLSRSRMHQSLS